jgi:hypothetical protein
LMVRWIRMHLVGRFLGRFMPLAQVSTACDAIEIEAI